MNNELKTPASVKLTLFGGVVLGAGAMYCVMNGAAIEKAVAAGELQVKARQMSDTSTENTVELHNLDNSFRSLAKFVGPAVVDIHSVSKRQMNVDGTRVPESEGEGSGFVISPDGYIATNDHVVGTADTVTVTLKDGREFTGKVTRANDANSDIALVKIEGSNLPYLSFSKNLPEPGEFAMAVGAPFGLKNSVTVGHVSALGRSNQEIGNHLYTDLIQTDAAINMGNSGGPLVNVDGQVIGMNTAIYSPTGGSNGIGFAIPATQVQLIENLLITKGKVVRSMIGLVPDDVKEYERTGNLAAGGARVVQVEPGPGQKAGIQKDDVIIKVGTARISDQSDLRNAMLAYAPGSTVPVQFYRGGQLKTANVTLEAYKLPKTAEQPSIQGGSGRNGMPFNFGPFNGNPFGLDPFGDRGGNGGGNGLENTPPIDHSGPAQLGVQIQDIDDNARSQFSIPGGTTGAVVVGVQPSSVASGIGMEQGDVVQSFNGKPITKAQDLKDALKGIKWGDVVHIKFIQFDGGNRLSVDRDVKFQ